MKRRSDATHGIPTTWSWRRWIGAKEQEVWSERLNAVEGLRWVLTERPNRLRMLLAAYSERRGDAAALMRKFGGQVRAVKASEWMNTGSPTALRIGGRFEIVDDPGDGDKKAKLPRLVIPHGMAFGSGEHATTLMLLRALARRDDWSKTSVLDLGTGSGVLALAARLLGARKMVATDFDPHAVRTAMQNEALNFANPLIKWRCADVTKLRAAARYQLVLANLFSGLLCEASKRIAECVSPGGSLWVSGVLRSQQEEVLEAFRRTGLKLELVVTRGKWVMVQFRRGG
jgi:ribosomal protein L11 methyltransferase